MPTVENNIADADAAPTAIDRSENESDTALYQAHLEAGFGKFQIVAIMKVIAEIVPCDLTAAKSIVEAAPSVIAERLPASKAAALKARLAAAGATARLVPLKDAAATRENPAEEADVLLELNSDGRAAQADRAWITEQYNRGAFQSYEGQFIAVVGRKLVGHHKSLKILREQASQATGRAASRIVTTFIDRTS